jgi:hypothetical protein
MSNEKGKMRQQRKKYSPQFKEQTLERAKKEGVAKIWE